MKKWLVCIGLLIILILIGIKWGAIREKRFVAMQRVHCNLEGANRRVCLDTAWRAWWPRESGYSYRITQRLNREVDWVLEMDGRQTPARLMLVPTDSRDSFDLRLESQWGRGDNPFEQVFIRLRAFLERPANIYGMDVHSAMATDSTLIVTILQTTSYPSMSEIYKRIGELRAYAGQRGGNETNPPMLHVVQKEGNYESMIAIPVDREIKGNGVFFLRKFVPWKVLEGEVRGGTHVAEQAFLQLQLYVQDHELTAMAVPFQSLVTERDRERDTSRWVTRVIVPVP